MQTKTIVLATFLTASLAIGSTAQAHDDYGYPIGVLSGVILGLSLDHGHNHNHYNWDRRHRHYPHREYRRQSSHGFQYGGRYKRHRHEHKRSHRRHHRD